MGDHLQGVITHQFDGTLAFCECIVERDFILRQPFILAPAAGRSDILCEIDKFLQHLNCANGVRVIPGNRSFQVLGETLRLNNICPAARADFIIQELVKSSTASW